MHADLARGIALLSGAVLTCLPATARAADDGFVYRSEWRKFAAADYVATGVVAAAAITIELARSGPTEPMWTDPLPVIDRPVRDAIVGSSREGRAQATDVSDRLWYASMIYPVVDVLVTPPLRGSNLVPVWQMTMMNLQAYASAALLIRVPQKFIGRSRPTVLGCEEDPDYSSQCDKTVRFVSFPGGHFGASMTGAGLTCAHHLHGDLYGGGVADALVCGGALGAALLVGYLRLYADEHWLSDQLYAGAMGIFSGYALPTLLYYRPFWRDAPRGQPSAAVRAGDLHWTLVPLLTSDALGLSLLVSEGG